MKPGPRLRPLADRFWPKVEKGEGCWIWTGCKTHRGYGCIGAEGGKPVLLAHRVSWELHYGPIPKGLYVLHHCDNPPCVRPDHLFLGTQSDNMRDMVAKGRDVEGRKTQCPAGHLYEGKNLYLTPKGGRVCRECARRQRREWSTQQRKGGKSFVRRISGLYHSTVA